MGLRLLDEEPIPDSLRYLVLKAAGGRCCQLCGIAVKERPLDVDHIIPRSRGGNTELANLQALCSKCNRSKRNQDDTDFRSFPPPSADPTCVFCQSATISKAVERNGSVFAIQDKYPVTPGHLLVTPIRHHLLRPRHLTVLMCNLHAEVSPDGIPRSLPYVLSYPCSYACFKLLMSILSI